MTVSPEVMDLLLGWSWPGNVRELESVVEYMATVCEGGTALLEHLPPDMTEDSGAARPFGETEVLLTHEIFDEKLLEWIRKLRAKRAEGRPQKSGGNGPPRGTACE